MTNKLVNLIKEKICKFNSDGKFDSALSLGGGISAVYGYVLLAIGYQTGSYEFSIVGGLIMGIGTSFYAKYYPPRDSLEIDIEELTQRR